MYDQATRVLHILNVWCNSILLACSGWLGGEELSARQKKWAVRDVTLCVINSEFWMRNHTFKERLLLEQEVI